MLENSPEKSKRREERMRPLKKEKRLHPRIEHEIPLKVIANGYDFATCSMNLSCVGAYCHIQKYVPPFTRVSVKFNLPMAASNRQKSVPVECKGVIVRSEDQSNGGYNVAIFFNGITEHVKQQIAHYLHQLLPETILSARA